MSLLARADEVIEMNPKHPPGPPMTLGNMWSLGVQRLVAYCLNPACRHEGPIDVSKYPEDTELSIPIRSSEI
jgi:hypothetical protein